jgi:hypothetical protein
MTCAPASPLTVNFRFARRFADRNELSSSVYHAGDPRAVLLLDLVRAAAPRDGRLAVAEAVLAEVAGKGLPGPNIDFALAVLTQVAGMAPLVTIVVSVSTATPAAGGHIRQLTPGNAGANPRQHRGRGISPILAFGRGSSR